ncbi:MAG: DUF362 domain-containing protein [Thermoproteota archaeon]
MRTRVLFSESLNDSFLEDLRDDMPFENEVVAIKLHMGEPKNKNHLKAEEVKRFIGLLKEIGCKPFLFDTTVTYPSRRNSVEGYLEVAALNGFTEAFMGCPIVIGGEDHEVVKGRLEYRVAKKLCGVSVLVLTHVKGHACSSIGAAIKNLGMGAMTKKTKSEIHEGGKPVYVGGCQLCGACVENCPFNAMRLDEDEERPRPSMADCWGCSNCTLVCPREALKPRIATFDFLLAEAAKAAVSKFRRVYFVNFLQRMTRFCDCDNEPLEPVIADIGILAGSDILAVEKATYDLIVKKEGRDVFKELNRKSFKEQLKAAEQVFLNKTV